MREREVRGRNEGGRKEGPVWLVLGGQWGGIEGRRGGRRMGKGRDREGERELK